MPKGVSNLTGEALEEWKRKRDEAFARGRAAPKKKGPRREKGSLSTILLDSDSVPLAGLVKELGEKYSLKDSQMSFMLWRFKFKNDAECARFVGLSEYTVAMWQRPKDLRFARADGSYPDFKSAYEEYCQRIPEVASIGMSQLGLKVVNVTEDLLDATKKNINDKGETLSEVPDWQARAKGVEIVSRWMGKGWNEGSDHGADPRFLQVMDRFNEHLAKLAGQKALPEPIDAEYTVIEGN